ncbi:MAG: sel1 repeat family protein [Alphaproteobacteria bacterium]|nr:sel1 repeat family protein [Alphaproteobacteria bacterium]
MAKRITNFLRIVIIVAGVIFSFSSWSEEDIRHDKQIICPNFDDVSSGSFLNEYFFANAYNKGYCGVVADKKKAREWYFKSAKHGYAPAQYQMGEIYFTGNGVANDYPEAKKWYLAAASQDHGLSQLRLGFLYAESHFKGLTIDYTQAEKWFLKAAEKNAGDARFRLGNFYRNYKNPPDSVKSVFWLTQAAEGGHRVAMFDLARMLKKGEGVPKDSVHALVWMKKAANLDLLSAQMTLSKMYAIGDGVSKDPVQSNIWTLKVADRIEASSFWLNKAGNILAKCIWESSMSDCPNFMMGMGLNVTKREIYMRAMGFYKRAIRKEGFSAQKNNEAKVRDKYILLMREEFK